MAFPLFKDIAKNANDLLKKGYPTVEKYSSRIEWDTISSSGMQFQPFLQRTAAGAEGELKAKFTVREALVTASGNLKEDITLEATRPFTPALKWTLLVASNTSAFIDRLRGKGTLEYRNDFTSTSASLDYTPSSGKGVEPLKVLVSSVIGKKDLGLAGGVDLELGTSGELKALNLAALFTRSDGETSLFAKRGALGTTVGANYFQKLSGDVAAGGEIGYDLARRNTTLILGAQFKPAETSTIKGRVDSKGLVGVSISDKLNSSMTLTWIADWNIFGDAPFQYGVKFAFK